MTPKEIPHVGLDHLHAPLVSIREQAAIVVTLLRDAGTLNFRELIAGVAQPGVVVARFLSVLELYRHAALSFEQLEPLGELTLRWTASAGPTRTSRPWEPTMTDDARQLGPRVADSATALAARAPVLDVARRLEAILLIVDEPQSLVSLADGRRRARARGAAGDRGARRGLRRSRPAARAAASSCARSAAAGACTCARSTTTSSRSSSTRRRRRGCRRRRSRRSPSSPTSSP